jgi:putative phage-type endonuclease
MQILPIDPIEEVLPPAVHFGNVSSDAAPPDLRLRAHPMRLGFTDERVNDPDVREWMEQRRLGVGASEIAVLFNLSPWQNLHELWDEKVNGCSYEAGSELFHFGHMMEPAIAAEFSRRTGEDVGMPESLIMIGEKNHHRASLDRVVLDNGVAVAALELKNLHEGRFAEYREAGPSVGYLLQLQYQMLIGGYDYGYLAAFFGGQKFAAWRVVGSPTIQAEILRRVDDFWGYVERKEQPPESLGKRAVVENTASSVTLTDPEWEAKLTELESIRLKKAKLEKEEKILRAQVKDVFGACVSAEAGNMVASISISTRRSLDTASLKKEMPEIAERFTKEAQVKTMRVRTRRS